MKIRWPELNTFLNDQPEFSDLLQNMITLYNRSPDRGRLKFLQAIEDQFKSNCVSRGRSSSGGPGSGWRNEQIALYSGRGAKWKKVLPGTSAFEALRAKLNEFAAQGIDIDTYQQRVSNAGYAWIRYSSPRGDVVNQLHAFEVRTIDSRLDHKENILTLTDEQAQELETLPGTPFALGIEGTRRISNTKPKEVEVSIDDEDSETPPPSLSEDVSTKSEDEMMEEEPTSNETEISSTDDLLDDLL